MLETTVYSQKVTVVFNKMGAIISLVAPLIMKGGMPMHEIFKKLSNRMVGAMMIHTQLTELFNFIDLEPDAKRQKKQLHEETDGLLKLEKYVAQHHHILPVRLSQKSPENIFPTR